MKSLNRISAGITSKYPIKVVQFGEGNFLRAFVDYVIDRLNVENNFNAGVAIVQPLDGGLINLLNEQDGLYTLFMRGIRKKEIIDKKRLIKCVQKGINPYSEYEVFLELAEEENLEFLISNTTESGIAYNPNDIDYKICPSSFPAKVTAFLHRRFQYFNGANDKGLTIIPCELINYNGETLKGIVLRYAHDWNLEDNFVLWLEKCNSFHNTLVDRIVPGYPKDDLASYEARLDYKDRLIVASEIFFLWVIEGDSTLIKKLPFNTLDENILVVNDLQPYRTRKVRILNGAHTAIVPLSIMYGHNTVKETMDDAITGTFLKDVVFGEINRTLPLPPNEVDGFAEEVFDRFRNPFIKHQLSSIALNSISKFKVRVLPSLLAYQKKYDHLPSLLTFSLACLLRFYKGNWKESILPVQDEPEIINFFHTLWQCDDYKKISRKSLANIALWDEDLTLVPNLALSVEKALKLIDIYGIEQGLSMYRNLVPSYNLSSPKA